MKEREEIEIEIQKHKEWLKENRLTANKLDKYLHGCIVEGLEWVLKEE